jgi:hypothetical protein
MREGREGELASELPSRHLPAVPYRDLPDALPLRKVLGPGIVSVGIGLGSGEFIFWPYVASVVGLVFLWAAILAVLTQFFINMEAERYTLATGETAITGFSRLWKPWGLIMVVCALVPNLFPGWATSAATALSFAVGGNPTVIAICALFALGAGLTLSPVIYQTLEKFEFVKVGAVSVLLLVALVFAIGPEAYGGVPEVVTGFGQIPDGLAPALVLGAVTAAGAGGMHNLVQSNWIRDKGYGMGKWIPRLVSPVTGEDQAEPSLGFMVRDDDANRERWRAWWRVANIEQFISFAVIAIVTICVMSLLAYATVFGQGVADEPNLDFLKAEGDALSESVGPWFATFFWVIGGLSLFGTALGILDYVGRIVGDVLKTGYLASSRFWTESKLYVATVWLLILGGTGVLLLGFEAPFLLLIVSQSINGMVMFVYSILLTRLNRTALPEGVRVAGFRLGAIIWACLFYGFFSAALLVAIATGNAG